MIKIIAFFLLSFTFANSFAETNKSSIIPPNQDTVRVVGISKKSEEFNNAQRSIGSIDTNLTSRTDVLTLTNFTNKNAFTLSEVISNSTTGLRFDSNEPVSGNGGVSISNLPSRFSAIFIDGNEISAGGVSGSIISNIINANAIESIKVSKGSRSNNFTAMNQANALDIKTSNLFIPKNAFDLSLQTNQTNISAFIASPIDTNNAIGISLFANEAKGFDSDGDGYAESAKKSIKAGSFTFESKDIAGTQAHLKFRQDIADQTTFGGAAYNLSSLSDLVNNTSGLGGIDFAKTTKGSPQSSSYKMPDGSGQSAEYEEGKFGLGEYTSNKMYMSNLQIVKDFDKFSYKFLGFYLNNTKQDYYHLRKANGKEVSANAVLAMQYRHNNFDIEYGGGYKLNSTSMLSQPFGPSGEGSYNNNKNDYRFLTSFLSANYEYKNLSLNAGFNYDSNVQLGKIFAPFLNSKISFGKNIEDKTSIVNQVEKAKEYDLRFGFNTAYTLPSNMFDLSHMLNIVNTKTVYQTNVKPERSRTIFAHFIKKHNTYGNFSLGINYTNIYNTTIIGLKCGNSTCGHEDESDVNIYNANGSGAFIKVLGIETTYAKSLSKNLFFGVGLEKYNSTVNTKQLNNNITNLPYLQNQIDYRLISNLSYLISPMQTIFFQLSLNKPQSLDKFGIEMYNLDGTQKANARPSYLLADIKYDYKLNTYNRFTKRNIFVFSVGINNILDFKQASKDSFIYLSKTGDLNHGNIWGPVVGRTMFLTVSAKM